METTRIEPDIIKEKFPDLVTDVQTSHGNLILSIPRERNIDILKCLMDDERTSYDFLIDVTAVDYLKYPQPMPERFAVIYQLYSSKYNQRLRIKAFLPADDMKITSVTVLWNSANWLERETYDMFGITFAGHPDLRRILMPDDYGSHPLLKDYPLKGRGERDNFKVVK